MTTLLTTMEVADRLRIHPDTVRRMCARGDLTVTRVGGRLRIHEDSLPTPDWNPRHRTPPIRTPRPGAQGSLTALVRELEQQDAA